MDGMYKILSAITKPTGKNIFEAGINGMIIQEEAKIICLEKLSHDLNITLRRLNNTNETQRIPRTLESAREDTRGIVPIVQSQQRSDGHRRSQRFRHGRYM
jgi:hypothetical protein